MSRKLEGRTAVVTGAGRGVGRAVALLFAEHGARVVCADNGSSVDGSGGDAGPAQAVVNEIIAAGGVAIPNTGDVSQWAEAESIVGAAIEEWGKLDILVNVAGNFRVNTVASFTEEDLWALVKVHIGGMAATSHFASLHWKERAEYGRLINFTSDSAVSGVPDTFTYAAAKGGVTALTLAAANGLAAYNVTANGMTQASASRMTDSYGEERAKEYFAEHGRYPSEDAAPEMRAETVGPLTLYLASPEAANISGRIFGSYGYRYILWNQPSHERTLDSDGPWDIDKLFEDFPNTLGKDLSISDMRLAMKSLDVEAGQTLAEGRLNK